MNVLHVHTHDSGRHFLHYGYDDSPTERIARWATANALTFRNAFSPAPTCSPSRASLLTGMYPHSNGMLGLAHRGFALNDYKKHLVPFLNHHGYRTALCGVQHEAADCFDHAVGAGVIGYREDISASFGGPAGDGDATSAWDRENARRAADWLTVDRQEPFFLSYGLYSTHREFPSRAAPAPGLSRPPEPLPNTGEIRVDHARFLESLRVVDECFGIVIDALENGPHARDTIVFVTTDHGIAQPFMKCNLNGSGQGVAFMIFVPGVAPPQPFTDALVSTVDLFPTLCDVIGFEVPPHVQGRSFAHLLREPREEHRDYVFGEVNFHTSYEPMRSVRTKTFNLVRNYDRAYPFTHASNIDDSPAKSVLLAGGLGRKARDPVELYDLATDPREQINVINDPRWHEAGKKLGSILDAWQQETNDPILNGEIARPPGSVVNRPECMVPDSEDPNDYLS